ncbi:hypothetical protein J1N35_000749 [Gossypium stocksii]|uniref:Zinc knuckle CX2CX4HX4C domain-containing protein n=1 Tax=Gossypium stocksii TaxID=47602 RepID=A0A9D3WI19_9ROSI|nr:hypothetical protein J1N35_000749 [Gossypium stocksii]
MEEGLANLNLLDEEEEAFYEDILEVNQSYHLCLVGRCLTDSVVHFPSLRNTMADLWHPIGGMYISDLGNKTILFQFFHEVDVQRVLSGINKFMCIPVRLDVSLQLKRKKKIQIGKERTVYARFQYKKLSLFCFICGRLGHGESFCPIHTRIDPSKIMFGWDFFYEQWGVVGTQRLVSNGVEQNRAKSWELLRQLGQDQRSPWDVVRDFNEIMHSFEKKGGRLRLERQMSNFREVLEDCRLIDLGFVGRWFTWECGRFLVTNIRERLDRGVASHEWMSLFPSYQVQHLNYSFSDHCSILLDLIGRRGESQWLKNKFFRFEAKWCLEHEFEDIVKRNWEALSRNVPDKLCELGQHFQHWNRCRSRKQKANRLDMEARLQELYGRDPSDEVLADITEVQIGLNLEIDKEEIFWAQ